MSPRPGLNILTAASLALLLAACTGGGDAAKQRLLAHAPADLDDMDGAVRAQYQQLKTRAEQALATGSAAQQAEVFGRLGAWYYVFQHDEPARQALQIAAESDSADPRWPALLGYLERRGGTPQASRTWWRAALELATGPGHVALLVELAGALIAENRLSEASELLEQARSRAPGNARVLYDLGQIALAKGDAATAVALLRRALVDQPDATATRYQLGQAYRALGDDERAREYLTAGGVERRDQVLPVIFNPYLALLQEFRVSARHLYDQARVAWRNDDHTTALTLLGRAVAAAPENPLYRVRLGSYLEAEGRIAEASRAYQRALALDSQSRGALQGRARILLGQKRPDEAMGVLEVLAEHYPDDSGSRLLLARLQEAAGDDASALSLLNDILVRDPRRVQARLWRTWVVVKTRGPDAALQSARGDVVALPRDSRLAGMLMRLRVQCEHDACENPTSVAEARATHASDPGAFNAETLAMALAAAGRLDDAIAVQESVVRALSIQDGGAAARLARRRLVDYQSGERRSILLARSDIGQRQVNVPLPVTVNPAP